MTPLRTAIALLAAAALGTSAPLLAKNNKTPPGNPCGDGPGRGTGNPCNGNNGNDGANGNAGGGGNPFQFEDIAVPPQDSRGVFIAQVGATNRAEARQTGNNAYARIVQTGDGNGATVDQDNGNHYASIAQDGDGNTANVGQEGRGQAVLMLAQQGDNNRADVSQTEAQAIYSAAAISQSGSNNLIGLVQDGSDNQARLVQNGDGNLMTATQLGNSNRLAWTQDGSGLSDMQVTQSGGQSMEIIQTNTGDPIVNGDGG
ncbi:hypothetical protein [Qipengyuania sp. MTN3-11]|uniref:hypothetical protein n=1 Tax=Qipengyuania sp. MTN3-11 TaxID=3056557 RepID=UPI0036F3F382